MPKGQLITWCLLVWELGSAELVICDVQVCSSPAPAWQLIMHAHAHYFDEINSESSSRNAVSKSIWWVKFRQLEKYSTHNKRWLENSPSLSILFHPFSVLWICPQNLQWYYKVTHSSLVRPGQKFSVLTSPKSLFNWCLNTSWIFFTSLNTTVLMLSSNSFIFSMAASDLALWFQVLLQGRQDDQSSSSTSRLPRARPPQPPYPDISVRRCACYQISL